MTFSLSLYTYPATDFWNINPVTPRVCNQDHTVAFREEVVPISPMTAKLTLYHVSHALKLVKIVDYGGFGAPLVLK